MMRCSCSDDIGCLLGPGTAAASDCGCASPEFLSGGQEGETIPPENYNSGRKTSASFGKLQKERESSKRDDTSDGDDSEPDSTSGTVVGELQSDTLSRTIYRIPSDPDLLPPGAQCDLAASKMTCFLDESHAVIPTGFTGTSWKRQDFLIIGKDRSSILGLIVYPSIISANCNEELTGLAKSLRSPWIIPENTSIAKAIALPFHAMEQVMPVLRQQDFPLDEHVEVLATWVKHLGQD
ncbi:hypothetical protein HGM15179_020449 [Zosterops borbonicus]|uniref:Uncharacterized protein n=1 Tax=Zosterops borbonicus TaxID=364589 RepID=A0A8K1D8R7_9PASS|nr:hypothetical protein HGM15179_020449 [Zosterops borbonicus]